MVASRVQCSKLSKATAKVRRRDDCFQAQLFPEVHYHELTISLQGSEIISHAELGLDACFCSLEIVVARK